MGNEARNATGLRTVARFVVHARLVQEHAPFADLRVLDQRAAWEMTFNPTYDPAIGRPGIAMKPALLFLTRRSNRPPFEFAGLSDERRRALSGY